MLGLPFYILIIGFTCIFLKTVCLSSNYPNRTFISNKELIVYLFILAPILFLYSVRYGIGTDYFTYKRIFELMHNSNIKNYFVLHGKGYQEFYIEPGFYFINKIAPNYEFALFYSYLLSITMIYYGTIKLKSKIDISFTFLIFFCTQFIYSMNGIRFSIAVTIIYAGIHFLIENKPLKWILIVFIASQFHTTVLICIIFVLLMNFKNEKINRIRNICYYFLIIFFPILLSSLILLFSKISCFSRYFTIARYLLVESRLSPKFLVLIIPIIGPILFFNYKFVFKDKKAHIFYLLYLTEIPFRELGLFNGIMARFMLIPQLIQAAFIPYVLSNIKSSKIRLYLRIYYSFFYIVYFCYYALVGDKGDSLPYNTIFFN